MKPPRLSSALQCAVDAAQAAGKLLRTHQGRKKKIDLSTQHDIKLELDRRCQRQIERTLQRAYPDIPILGEEGVLGNPRAPYRWVVDPIDGTVNFAYGIPHCCTAIALQANKTAPEPARQTARRTASGRGAPPPADSHQTLLGVILDPFCDEIWTAIQNQPARLNGRAIRTSARSVLSEAVVGIGFAKESRTLRRIVPAWNYLIHRVRKVRIMGSAALELAYVASGRLDAFVEYGLRIWDVAAGGLLVESAGGSFWQHPIPGPPYSFHIVAGNRPLHASLARFRKSLG